MKATSENCTLVVPFYNSRHYLPNFLANTLQFLGAEDELLLVNDGSNDVNSEELANYLKWDKRIRLLNKSHTGLVDTLNFGVHHACNSLIARLDIDDFLIPGRIELQKEALLKDSTCAAVFCDYSIISNGRMIGTMVGAVHPKATVVSLCNSLRTPHPGVMFRKEAYLESGGYIQEDFPAEDLGLWLRMARHWTIKTLPKTLLIYSLSTDGVSLSNRVLMLEKKKSLVRAFFANWQIEDIDQELKKSFSEYNSMPESIRRQLLLLYDSVFLIKYIAGSKSQVIKFLVSHLIFFFKKTFILELKKLAVEAYLRRKLRR